MMFYKIPLALFGVTSMDSVRDKIGSNLSHDVEFKLLREVHIDVYWEVYEANKSIVENVFHYIWDELDGLS